MKKISFIFSFLFFLLASAPSFASEYLDKAEQVFLQLLQKTPNDPDVHRYLGDIATQRGDHKTAKEWYQKALLNIAQNPPKNDDQQAAYGRIQILLGQIDEGSSRYELVIKQNPEEDHYKISYIQTLLDVNQYQQAKQKLDEYEESMKQSAEFSKTKLRYVLSQGSHKEAKAILAELKKRKQFDQVTQDDAAYLYLEERDWENGLPLIESLTNRYPQNNDHHFAWRELYALSRPHLKLDIDNRILSGEKSYQPKLSARYPFTPRFAAMAAHQSAWHELNNSNFDAQTNITELGIEYKPHHTTAIRPSYQNQFLGSKYFPGGILEAEWNNNTNSRILASFNFSELSRDPVAGLQYELQKHKVSLLIERAIKKRFFLSGSYTSRWYRLNSGKAGLGLGKSFGREDEITGSLNAAIFLKPRLELIYRFRYSRLGLDNNYLNLIPLIERSELHAGALRVAHRWNRKWYTQGEFFVGHDRKRNLKIGSFDLYGTSLYVKYFPSKNWDLEFGYEYSSESTGNSSGWYQFIHLGITKRF